jgi:hypothetical protein
MLLDRVDIEGFKDILAAENSRYAIIADMASKNIFFGTAGNDSIQGTNAGNVFWVDRGNNTIRGGRGDNIYFLGKDFGTNTLIDDGGNNTVFFLSDMPQVNVEVMPNTYDVELTAVGGTGKVIIKNFNQNATYRLVFADGNTFDMNLMELIEQDDALSIRSVKDLENIQNNLFGEYRLMADIDLADVAWTPIGTSAAPFAGVLDGNGYTIKNLNVNMTGRDYVGLFGYNTGTVKNLKLENATVKGRNYTGSVAGHSSGILENIAVSGSVIGSSYVGGFVGQQSGGTIENCAVTDVGTRLGGSYVGGFVGYNTGNIRRSYTTADVKGTGTIGGFVGYFAYGGIIEQSYATGDVYSTGSYIGGFVGSIGESYSTASTVRESFSTGHVVGGSSYTAGFVGNINANGKVENSYSLSGNTNGFNYNGTVTNSYFNSDILEVTTTKPEARTTEEMQRQATYVGWDFENVWEIEEGTGYPTLKGLDKPTFVDIAYTEISTAEEFSNIRNDLLGSYRLTADIDLSGMVWEPIGTSASPFWGVLNGNGYAVKNLNIDLSTNDKFAFCQGKNLYEP